jgi:hypothetical protein
MIVAGIIRYIKAYQVAGGDHLKDPIEPFKLETLKIIGKSELDLESKN